MRRAVLLVMAGLGLCGCQPTYSKQEIAAVTNARQVNEQLARDHKITWAEAARREVATALQVGGERVDADEKLLFSLKVALAAEVDAGRLTPEMADYRYNEGVAKAQSVQEAKRQAAMQAFGDALQNAGQSYAQAYQAARPINCTSFNTGAFTNTHCN